jgi:O-antigen/teichoic acid export membrane protein
MNRSPLASNLLAGLVSAGWSGLAALIVVPYYIAALGIANYGLITFYAMMQGLFVVFDLGLSTAINREVARSMVPGCDADARNLFRTLTVLYWVVGVLIGGSVILAAPLIGQHWLHSASLDEGAVILAIRLMGLVFVFRWPIGLYLGVLQGGQRIVSVSVITIIGTTLATFGAVATLQIAPATMVTFFIWQAGVALLQVLAMRHYAWRVFGDSSDAKFTLDEVRRIWRFSGLIALTTVMGAVLLQADKLLLSTRATLEDVAIYGLAGLAARSLLLIVSPIFSAVYPRMSAVVAGNQTDDLIVLYRVGTKLLSIALCAIGAYLCFQSFAVFRLWTHSNAIAEEVRWIVPVLVIGTILNGVMYFPHALQLAYGDAKLPLQINAVLFVFLLPALIVLVPQYGALGAALAWLGMNIINMLLGTWLTHRSLLPGMGMTWLFRDVLVPGLAAAALIWAGVQVLPFTRGSTAQAILALPLIPIAILLVSVTSADIRTAALRWGPYRSVSSAS